MKKRDSVPVEAIKIICAYLIYVLGGLTEEERFKRDLFSKGSGLFGATVIVQ